MIRPFALALASLALVSPASFAQDGPLRKIGRALDNAGRNTRMRVENEVAREQISAQEREVLNRVIRRIDWDKQLVGSTLQTEVRPGGSVVLRGSVLSESARRRAVDLVENTIGVTSVVDELGVVKDVKVIDATPGRVVEIPPPLPAESKVIISTPR